MFTKRLFAFITVIILLFTFVGCSDNYDSAIIYFGVNEPPKNAISVSASMGTVDRASSIKLLTDSFSNVVCPEIRR